MKCGACGGSALQHDTRDYPYTYKGQTTMLPGVTGDFCPDCGEVTLTMDDVDRFGGLVDEAQKRVNSTLVDLQFIIGVRKKLALDQREASALFGGGVNAFSRYETGKTRPPVALVKLLKVLDRHPELLDEIRAA